MLAAVEVAAQVADEEVVVTRPKKRGGVLAKSGDIPVSLGKPVDALQLLARGVVDIREAAQHANTSQLVTMALETVYKGLGFSRAIAFLRSTERNQYSARRCLGEGAQDMFSKLVFSDAYQPDVFHAALANDKMIFVENATDPAFAAKLPRWWKETLASARSFMVLPLTINRNPIGFIYGDWELSVPPSKIEPPEVVPLNELRSLLVAAIEHRRQISASAGKSMFE